MGMTVWVVVPLWCVVLALASKDSPIYNIKIKKDPVKLSEVGGDHFEIVSVYGQQFTCIVPTIAQRRKPKEDLSETAAVDIKNVFSSWNSTDCLIWSAGWWNYKLCTGKEISQYHEDKGSTPVTTSLGTFTRDFDWTQADPSDLQVRHKYHSQFYDHGTLCDVTGKPRSTEVRFVCRRDLPFPTILDVTEVLTCSYVVRVAAADLCAISVLEPQDDLKPSELVCSPSLSDEAYSKFEQAKSQRTLEQNLLKEEREFQKTLSSLPARRHEFHENVLKSRRSYRKRLNLGLTLTARRLRKQSIDFLRLVENNFDDLNQFSVKEILTLINFKQPLKSGQTYGHEFSGEPNLVNLVKLLKSLISFQLPRKGTETAELVLADGNFLRRLEVYNRTLDITSILLDHVRRSFEDSVGAGRRPRTLEMVAGFLNLIRRLVSMTSLDVLDRVQRALQRYRPRRIYQPRSGSPSFDEFLVSSQLGIERSTLGILNSTVGVSRNIAKIFFLQAHVSSFLSNEYSIKTPEHILLDEMPFTSEDLYETDHVALAESLTQLRNALNNPKLQTTLKALMSNKAHTLSLRASVQPMDDDRLALVITVHDDVAKVGEHEENAENYKTRITFG